MLLRLLLLLGFIAGCNTAEGVRCNQLAYTDECGSGLTCTVPDHCPALVAYCCPTGRTSAASQCAACPPPDGGGGD